MAHVFGTKEDSIEREIQANHDGTFKLDFEASGFQLIVSCPGFESESTNFIYYEGRGQDTNQILTIHLRKSNSTHQPEHSY